MLARILTENKDYGGLLRLVNRHTQCFTVIKAEGIWKSIPEHSLIIEIETSTLTKQDIEHIAFDIKKHNNQQAVLVQYLQCESKLI